MAERKKKSELSRDSAEKPLETLWVVTELYYPEETSTGYYLTRIAEGLADVFRVNVLCGQPNYLAKGRRAPSTEVHRKVEIHRAWGTTLDKNVILFRLINMLSLGLSIFVRALLNFRKGDRVLVVTTPPSLPFVAALAALLRGAGYVLLIHDNYPEILIAAGKTRRNSLIVRFSDFLNRWLYKYAAKIIVVGRDMNRLVGRKTAGLEVPILTIPNWAELEQVEPAPREGNRLLLDLGLSKKLVFLYAGNMGHPNDLESIVACAEKLADDDRFQFVFLGTGVKRKWLERARETKNLKNVTVLPPQPRSEQKVFLNACDIGVVSLVSKMWGVSMPSRTYNILAAGKPILALTEPDSEIDLVVRDDDVGWAVAPDDPEKLLEVILEIYANRSRLVEMGVRARRAAVERYGFDLAIQRYKIALGASDNESGTK